MRGFPLRQEWPTRGPAHDPGVVQWGVELRPQRWSWRLPAWRLRLVSTFGADFKAFEEQDWEVTASLAGGVELSRPGTTRRFRLVLLYLRGFLPFGQFFNQEKIENMGFGVQFEI